MNRTDRLIAIVLLLHSRKTVRAKDIAQRFDIALRTVYRDMKALNEAGVPIAAEPGEGYSLVEGYYLPPIMFTADEAGSLYLGAELVRSFTDFSISRHVDSALMKIQSVLPQDKREYLEQLQGSTTIVARPKRAVQGFRDDVLRTLQDAVIHRQVIYLEYFSGHREDVTRRQVEPLGTLYYADRWHLIGYCRLRSDYRDFRTDRIKALQVLDERFANHRDFSLQRFVEGFMEIKNPREVKILFRKPVLRYIRDRVYFGVAEEKETPDGVIMTFLVPTLDHLAPWLLSFGRNAEIVSPEELRERTVAFARDMVHHHDETRAKDAGGAAGTGRDTAAPAERAPRSSEE
jgi:predicted DNA-binding transcriptional regulator YafY